MGLKERLAEAFGGACDLARRPAGEHGEMRRVAAVERPTVTWGCGKAANVVCSNCGSDAAKERLLTVNFRSPDHPSMRHWDVLACPACTARFYENQTVPDYAEAAMLERGRVPFYVQQGAGVSLITRPLARVRVPAGSQYLEVGCGYGFGLDYAIRARGWHGRGIDPAKLSELARDHLNLPIEVRYLDDETSAAGTCDLVMGSEVIEHVPVPFRFVATLRKLLKPGGLLILTTPNGEEIVVGASPGALVPMLSPGLHLVLQTPTSLRRLLEQAGFSHIELAQDGHSLVAFASDEPFSLETDQAMLDADYRAHLLRRATAMPSASDLALGFAGRCLLDSINAGDPATADAAWSLLVPACRERFGFEIETLTKLPARAATADLESLSRLMPLNLAVILYAGCIRLLNRGASRSDLVGAFAAAAAAADALRQALGKLAMEDGLTEDIGWVSRMEALICLAAAGAPDVARQLAALPQAPGGEQPAQRRAIAVRRVFVALVNAGHYDLARRVAAVERLNDAAFAQQPGLSNVPLETSERDALFCLAVLDLQPPSDLPSAGQRFHRVIGSLVAEGGATPSADALIWSAIRGGLSAADQQNDPAAAFNALLAGVSATSNDPSGLPPDLAELWPERALDQFIRLMLAGNHKAANDLCGLAGLRQRLDEPVYSEAERRSLRFMLATLDAADCVHIGRALAGFRHLRSSLAPDDPLLWPTVRAAIALPGSATESRDLLVDMTNSLPREDVPADLLERIDGRR